MRTVIQWASSQFFAGSTSLLKWHLPEAEPCPRRKPSRQLSRSGFAAFCETLGRHEDAIPKALKRHLFAYFAPQEFAGKRMLDFGCGTGASTFAMAKLLPRTEIIGVELSAERVELANRIRSHRRLSNAQVQCSPAPARLPPGIGEFDFVILSAVYEHLLPNERRIVMPLLWPAMKPGGVIFINQTPYRYSPYEAYSTGLWFINYLPDHAHWTVRRFRQACLGNQPLSGLERASSWCLRGATENEIVRNLMRGETCCSPRILQPRQNGLRDRADFWLAPIRSDTGCSSNPLPYFSALWTNLRNGARTEPGSGSAKNPALTKKASTMSSETGYWCRFICIPHAPFHRFGKRGVTAKQEPRRKTKETKWSKMACELFTNGFLCQVRDEVSLAQMWASDAVSCGQYPRFFRVSRAGEAGFGPGDSE